MQPNYPRETLRIGLLGTGFVAHFHLQALQNVRRAGRVTRSRDRDKRLQELLCCEETG